MILVENTNINEFNNIFESVEFINEGLMSPIRKYINKINDIKNSKPNAGTEDEDVKKFVVKYYDDIIVCANILENEPAELGRANTIIKLVSNIAHIIGAASMIMPSTRILGIVLTISTPIIKNTCTKILNGRVEVDKSVIKNMIKIKRGLKDQVSRDDIDKDTKSRIHNLISKIDDMETESSISTKIQMD